MKRRIKVLHLTVGLGWGGAEKLMADIAVRLSSSRYDCHVVSLKGDGPVGDILRKAGIRVVSLGGGSPWKVFQELRKHVIREGPDIVHSHLLKANLLGALVPGSHKLFWHIHNTSEQTGFIWRFLERCFSPRAGGIIAVSEAVGRDIFLRIPSIKERLRVIPNGIDPALFSPLSPIERGEERRKWGLSPDAPVIGYVGRLEEKTKKITHLIEAFAQVKKARPAVKLLLVGDGRDRLQLESFVREKVLTDAILFVGAHVKVEKFYPLMDVYVQSSVSEGFGISLLEAMSCAVPVVSTLTGGIPEIVVHGETGILVAAGNSLALAKAIEAVLSDKNYSQVMGNFSRQRVGKRFNIQTVLGEIERLYEINYSSHPD